MCNFFYFYVVQKYKTRIRRRHSIFSWVKSLSWCPIISHFFFFLSFSKFCSFVAVRHKLQWVRNNGTDPAARDTEGRVMVFVGRGEFMFSSERRLLVFVLYETQNSCDSPHTARADRSVTLNAWPENILLLSVTLGTVTFLLFYFYFLHLSWILSDYVKMLWSVVFRHASIYFYVCTVQYRPI